MNHNKNINKITQSTNGNVRMLDASDVILHQINRNKTVYLDPEDSTAIYICDKLNEHTFTPKETIRLSASQVGFIGGVAFTGTAQDLIDLLDGYFFE
jgi:hypothetical protein